MSDYTKIILKNSPIPEAFPLADFLDHGEIALNYADHKLYYKSISGEIVVHETPNIDVDSTRNSIVRRDPFGAGNFAGLISNQDDADLYSLKAVHTNGTAVKVIGSGTYPALDVSASGGGPGATISSIGGHAVQAHSTNGLGAFITSVNSTGAFISSANGTYHAVFGSGESNDRLAVGRSRGALTWFYSANPASDSQFSGKLKIADISDDRNWFLPDATGTLAVYTTDEWVGGKVLTAGDEPGAATWETPFGGYSSFAGYDNEIHVSVVDGDDTIGNGDLLNPVASITAALLLVTGARKTIIVHPGTYAESPNITVQATNLNSYSPLGGTTIISGTLSTSVGCTIAGFQIGNLNITTPANAGDPHIIDCTITGTLTKSGSAAFTEIHHCDINTACNVTGSGLVTIDDCNLNFLTVNHADANVLVRNNPSCVSPVLSAGRLNLINCIVIAADTNGITTSAESVITIADCQIVTSALSAVAPIVLNGFYSIFNVVYDKPNSTLAVSSQTGGSTNSVDYFQYINADRLIFDGVNNGAGNAFETTLSVVEPTADRTITLPNASGTVAVYTGEWSTGKVLTSSGNPGEARWLDVGGSTGGLPAGEIEGQVQLRNADGTALAADPGLVYTGTGNLGVLKTGRGQIAINALPYSGGTLASNIGIGFNPFIPTPNASNANNVGGNIGIGDNTLDALDSANPANVNNIAIGTGALKSIATCGSSVFIGTSAGTNLTTSSNSTIIGDGAGRFYGGNIIQNLTEATSCTFVGRNIYGSAAASTNQIVIGSGAIGDQDNSAVIGNANTTQTRLAGNTLKLGSATSNTSIVRTTATTGLHTIYLPGATGTLPVYTGTPAAGLFLRAADPNGAATWATAVTSLAAGNGLTTGGAAITTIGTISLKEIMPALPVTTITNATIMVDVYGRVIFAENGSSAAAAAGINGQVQFNNAGVLGANNGLVYAGTGDLGTLKVGGGSICMSSTTPVATAPNNISIGTPFTGTLTTGNNNVSVGSGNFQSLTSGSTNVACGSYSLVNIATGSGNTAIGHNAGANVTSGSNNIFINRGADNGTHSSQILIGGKSDGASSTVIGFEGDNGIAATESTRFIGNKLTWGSGVSSVNNRTSLVQTASGAAKTITLPNANGTLPVYATGSWPSTTPTAYVLTASSTTGLATWATAVTTVTAGTGLTVSNGASSTSITGTGTIGLDNSGVTANTYNLATIAVDAYGRITSASSPTGLAYEGTIPAGTGKLTVGGGRIYMDSTTPGIQPNNIAIGGGTTLAFASLTPPTTESTGNSKNNVSIGAGNFGLLTTGQRNVVCGSNALKDIITGNRNTAIGDGAGLGVTTGSNNIFINRGAVDGTANSQIVLGATSDGANSTVIGFDGGGAPSESPTTSTRFIGNTLTWGSGVSSVNNRTSLVQTASTSAKIITLPNATGTLPVYTGSWPSTTPTAYVLTASSTTGLATWAPVSALSNTTLSGYSESHILLGSSGTMVASQTITTEQLLSATVFAGYLNAASTLTLPTATVGRSLTLMIQTGNIAYPLTLGNAYQAGAPTLPAATDSITFTPNSVTLIVCNALIRTISDPFWSYTVGQSTLTPP